MIFLFQASKLNRGFSADRQISYMTWVAEGILNQDQPWQSWKPRSETQMKFIGRYSQIKQNLGRK
jgi:hypothetical protein